MKKNLNRLLIIWTVFSLIIILSFPVIAAYPLLRVGSTGEEVKEVQTLLKELDLLQESPDGIYGERTQGAVESLQRILGLTVDGVVGEETREALQRAAGQVSPLPLLSPNQEAPEVLYLRIALAKDGFLSLEHSTYFDVPLQEGVKSFQRERGLDVDGVVGPLTWDALKKREYPVEEEPEEEKEVTEMPLLRPGDRGDAVRRLQEKLAQFHFYHSVLDGHFGHQTQLSVIQFQEFNGLTSDGIVGSKTWAAFERTGSEQPEHYTIVEGDTLWKLAQKWNTTLEEIQRLNNLSNIHQLQIGNRLYIPGRYTMQEKPVQLLHWNQVNSLFPEESIAILTDVESGLSFRIQRLFGTNHADVEPLTAQDTETLRTIYGGKWSWERRAVVFQFNGYLVAGSINGFPHDSQSIYHNNFNGHICLHFHGSRLHNSGHIDTDHQEQVQLASQRSWPLVIEN